MDTTLLLRPRRHPCASQLWHDSTARAPAPHTQRPMAQQDDEADVDDGAFEDWGDEEAAPTRSLFGEKVFDSAVDCLAWSTFSS